MGTPNPNFVREHGEKIIDEVLTAMAGECDCMKGGCPHDRIRELVHKAFAPAIAAIEKRLPDLPTDAAVIRLELAGALGELDGMRVSEAFFRTRCDQLEAIFEHLKDVWLAVQALAVTPGLYAGSHAAHHALSMVVLATTRAQNNVPPPALFSPEDRAALRTLATWVRELDMMPEAEAYDRALAVIDRIAPKAP